MMTDDYKFSNGIRIAVKKELQESGQYSDSLWEYLEDLFENSSQGEVTFWSEILAAVRIARPRPRLQIPTQDVDY